MKETAYLAFALLGVIWGSNFIFMKWAVEYISPSQIVLLRVVFGFLPIFLFALAKGTLRLGTHTLCSPLCRNVAACNRGVVSGFC